MTCANNTEASPAPAEADVGWSGFRSLHQLAGCLQGPSSLGIYAHGAQAASCSELFHSVPVSTWFYFHVPEVCVFVLAVLAIASYPTMHSKTTQFLTLLASVSAKSVQS